MLLGDFELNDLQVCILKVARGLEFVRVSTLKFALLELFIVVLSGYYGYHDYIRDFYVYWRYVCQFDVVWFC